MSKIRLTVLLIVAIPASSLAAAFLLAPRLYEKDLATSVAHREADWTGSTTCQSCHPDHYASWDRTFHSTMTQIATPQSVLGAFDGRKVTYWGVTARPVRRGDEFFMEYLSPAGKVSKSLKVRLTVGSRRYQQYVVEAEPQLPGDTLYRIPLLWSIEAGRWIHLNGAFLGPDDVHYDNHLTTWNQNCIFCHNTGPQPGSINFDQLLERSARGEQIDPQFAGQYESKVVDHGIACESCHAPAGQHAARNRNPLRRYLLHLTGKDDPTIVNPSRLTKERSVEVCGQCHGQRLPDPPGTIRDWVTKGPSYRAGEVLTASVKPVSHDTPGPPHMPDMFQRRFWNDGTPRLTAYEYQGITMSPCYIQGELTCMSCHNMHGGDVRGQIDPVKRTNEACRSCHAEMVDDPQSHTHHEPEGAGSSCYSCHMPKIIFGVQEIHRSHRIENPDAASDVLAARPNACTSCHVDQSAPWAAEKTRLWWGRRQIAVDAAAADAPIDPERLDPERLIDRYQIPDQRGDGAPLALGETVAALFAGDPVQRAVAARLAGRRDTPLTIEERAFLWPVLLQGLADTYPSVRWFCRRSLLDLQEEAGDKAVPGLTRLLEKFDYILPLAQREIKLAEIRNLWTQYPKDHLAPPPENMLLNASYELNMDEVTPLLVLKSNKMIDIGE